MKVYIVMEDWGYDGREIYSVWADEGKAVLEAMQLMRDRHPFIGEPRYYVREWEVKS